MKQQEESIKELRSSQESAEDSINKVSDFI